MHPFPPAFNPLFNFFLSFTSSIKKVSLINILKAQFCDLILHLSKIVAILTIVILINVQLLKYEEEFTMAKDPRQMLTQFTEGLEALGTTNPANLEAFMNLLGSSYEPGSLDLKTKELISIAIGAYNRCEYCIVFHTYKALEAGATRKEIMEAAMVSAAFGGGPTLAYTVTLLKDSIDEFEKDFM